MRRQDVKVALAAVLLVLGAAGMAGAQQGGCRPPGEMRAKLAGTPTADSLNELGVWFGDRKQYDCAAQAFATSLQISPQQPPFRRVIFLFGASLFYAGDTQEAAQALEEAERVGYRDKDVYALLAEALDRQHDTEKAAAQWKLALDFDPDSASVLDALSGDLLALGRYNQVVELLTQRRVRALRSQQQVANLAAAYTQLDQAEQAAKVLQDGLNTYPGSRQIAGQLVEVLTSLHQDEEAATVGELLQDMDASNSQEPAAP